MKTIMSVVFFFCVMFTAFAQRETTALVTEKRDYLVEKLCDTEKLEGIVVKINIQDGYIAFNKRFGTYLVAHSILDDEWTPKRGKFHGYDPQRKEVIIYLTYDEITIIHSESEGCEKTIFEYSRVNFNVQY